MRGLEHMAEDIGQDVYAKLAGQPADRAALAAKIARRHKGRQPMIGTAWAADAASTARACFSDPAFWVAVAFFLFFALAGKVLWGRISGMLDKRSADIAKALADAARLREEAMKAKQDAERTLGQAAAEGAAIIQQAREEAERMQARAAQNLETAVALREQQALDRIAQSEAAATKEVRDTAVDVALSATRALLREQVGSGRSAALVDEAIAELPRRLHYRIGFPAQKKSRATWQPPSQGGGFFFGLHLSSPRHTRGGYRRGKATQAISPIS